VLNSWQARKRLINIEHCCHLSCRGKGKIGGIECDWRRCQGRAEIWRNQGGISVRSTRDERLIQAVQIYPNTDSRSRTHVCRDKTIDIKYFQKYMCNFTLTILHEKARALLYCRLLPVRLYSIFPLLKITIKPNICVVLFFTILSETFPIHRRIEHYVINEHGSSCKVPHYSA
jgi:hypothetical protein